MLEDCPTKHTAHDQTKGARGPPMVGATHGPEKHSRRDQTNSSDAQGLGWIDFTENWVAIRVASTTVGANYSMSSMARLVHRTQLERAQARGKASCSLFVHLSRQSP